MNPSWDTLERSRQARLERAAPWARGREVAAGDGAHPAAAGCALLADLVRPAWSGWLSG